jgi:hypothetical protein
MAEQGKTIPSLPVVTSLAANDKIVVVSQAGTITAQTALISTDNLARGFTVLSIPRGTDPANSSALTITANTIFASDSFVYVATSDNHVKRIPLSDF